ncbi:MAG: hypothetical protein NDJ90_00885 [Oligoflexia bacterium]|nr:hypothetical protein [Oligoflexia bacterium]
MESQSQSGSTKTLLQLCLGYFGFYILTGIAVKYYTDLSPDRISQIAFLFNNTAGSNILVLLVVFAVGMHKAGSQKLFSRDSLPILYSGICTAVVIPTTTLMYLLPISVMVAMVIMRGSVIIISRLVDEIQIRQGILKKKVSWEEDLAIVFALMAVGMNLLLPGKGKFDFVGHPAAMVILTSYLTAYFIRLYIMNYFKNSAVGLKINNQAFFAREQVVATLTLVLVTLGLVASPRLFAVESPAVLEFQGAVFAPSFWPMMSGIVYGAVAFFSVLIFMFRGRTATFAGLVNRLTSLVAGTTSTLLLAYFFGTRMPSSMEWMSLLWIGVAVGLLTRAELKYAGKKLAVAPVVPAEKSLAT